MLLLASTAHEVGIGLLVAVVAAGLLAGLRATHETATEVFDMHDERAHDVDQMRTFLLGSEEEDGTVVESFVETTWPTFQRRMLDVADLVEAHLSKNGGSSTLDRIDAIADALRNVGVPVAVAPPPPSIPEHRPVEEEDPDGEAPPDAL